VHNGVESYIDVVADHRQTRTSTYIMVGSIFVGSSGANATMAPDGAVRSKASEDLRGDRMDHHQAWADFADWPDVRTSQEQVHVPEEAGEKAMISPKEVVRYPI
jgi:hypothetical protein